jgi:CheY-like chemotaxis protein/anti-sigma regulatory factor (Ser/Thr protein kinase)
LLETVLVAVGPAAEAARVTLQADVAPDLPPIEGDARRLQQILNNVLSNALKFTPEGGTVSVRCDADHDTVHIAVEDTGIGIAPDFLPFVFERFRQADSRSTRTHGGLGLGLAIARHLVERHGGQIHAHSDGPGLGTVMSIRLPAGGAGRLDERHSPVIAKTPIGLGGITVLVVDDDPDSREVIAALLEQRGAAVVDTDSAVSALARLETTAIDLMVADIAMPHVDGYELMQRVRAAGNAVPAIALTAFARHDDRRTALRSGYTGYIAKPFDADELVRTVRDLVNTSRTSSSVPG